MIASRRGIHWRPVGAAVAVAGLLAAAALLVPARAVEPLRTDSRAPYAHRLNPLEHMAGQVIAPGDVPPLPYSPMATCSKACHAYGEIAGGWHFNAPDADVPPGRPGEPWVLTDDRTGTQIPLSYRRWRGGTLTSGTYAPGAVGLAPFDFTQRFGRHMPGGGVGEKFAQLTEMPSPRWDVSGRLEIDCMSCHASDGNYDGAEWARQVEQQNFMWAPTAAYALASVRGSAKARPDGFDPIMSGQQMPPLMQWDPARFDPDGRILYAVDRRGSNERCFFCHTVHEVGPDAAERWTADQDVHVAAGMRCAECHRNGIGHDTVRGYEGEAAQYKRPEIASLTCRGCHLGVEGQAVPGEPGGRLGAPRPAHAGLPTLHLERISCTACHAGPWPQQAPRRYQTSMNHALGLTDRGFGTRQERARTEQSWPRIVAPVFLRQDDGAIGPHRLFWPSFWGRMKDGQVAPLAPEAVLAAAGRLLPAPTAAPAEEEAQTQPATAGFDEQTLAAVLEALGPDEDAGAPVYVAAGRLHRLESRGALVAEEHPAARPYAWAMGHDVRPASQSLGAGGCTDCHASDAPFFFSEVTPEGPVTMQPGPVAMHTFERLDPTLQAFWGLSFRGRPWMKLYGSVLAAILALVLLAWTARAVRALSRRAMAER